MIPFGKSMLVAAISLFWISQSWAQAPEPTEMPQKAESKPPPPLKTSPDHLPIVPPAPNFQELLTLIAENPEDKAWLDSNLARYIDQAEYIFIGEIIEHHKLQFNQGKDISVSLNVKEWILGDENTVFSVEVPYNAPYIHGSPETVPPIIVNSYVVLVFADRNQRVIDGNALFVVEDAYAWRNKRPSIFLSPRFDREWKTIDPSLDYVVYSIENIRIKTQKAHPNTLKFWRWRKSSKK